MGLSNPIYVFRMSIRDRMIALRQQHKLTQHEMADMVGLHVNQIRRYETGHAQPSLDALKKIAVALRITLDELVFDEGERGPAQDLRLQFEAISQFDDEDRLVAQAVLEGLILKYQAKQALSRQDAAKKKTG
ncbi:helix-turn-helix domain-containing protein [Permianibacter aggregans]|uniref:Helix-turn-helix protein n=1 Tax=Permianibacter aggregans TaxID=1510150 RepID=A0A4R6UVF8_9GAMM|nr:helix-turn-helix transcriptional regulator [Permianibacter aggregans]QGX41524.1 XRE family transcriptional regulator [Permianibacter aggregans]TDQ51320.1 helix-turn-helix protein [Permianibacter aggregans]